MSIISDDDGTATSHRRNEHVLILCILVLWTVAVFFPVLTYGFISQDDGAYVYENPYTSQGLTRESVQAAFTREQVSSWFPLTLLSYMLDVELFGVNAGAHHGVNLGIHLCNVILLYWALVWMTRSPYLCGIVSALFALHPLHVESVVWISCRKELLCTFFLLLTLLAYLRYLRRPHYGWYVLLACFYTLGMLAKSMLITLPLLLLFLDFWPLGRLSTRKTVVRAVLEKIPLLAIGGVVAFVSTRIVSPQIFSSLEQYPMKTRLVNAVVSYAIYLSKTFFPVRLVNYYPYPDDQWNVWHVLGSVVLLSGITAYAVFRMSRRPYLIVGWLWFIVSLAPVIGIVHFGGHLMADHYTYIPLIGFFFAFVWLIHDTLPHSKAWNQGLLVAGISALAVLSVVSVRQIHLWSDELDLYTHTLNVTGPNSVILSLHGGALLRKGDFESSTESYEAALRMAPNHVIALNGLGIAYAFTDRFREAEFVFTKALELDPDLNEARVNLGTVRRSLSETEKKIVSLEETISQEPEDVTARTELAALYISVARFDDAFAAYRTSLELDPSRASVLVGLGDLQKRLGNFNQAVEHYERALTIDPENPPTLYKLARALLDGGRPTDVIGHLEKALRIRPDFVQATNLLKKIREENRTRGMK